MTTPPGAAVRGNRWPDIPVPALGEWTPTALVSIVIPHFEAHDELARTLAAVANQSYPDELLEVLVVDDGSRVAPTTDGLPDSIAARVLVQEDLGFGLARARNLGAESASGEILVFLDCDMMPEAHHAEAHARWHHAVSNAVVFGFRFHAEFGDVDPDEVGRAVAGRGLASLVGDQQPQRPEWVEDHMERTEDLTADGGGAFLVTSGGNLSIRTERYLAIGGTDATFSRWGGEDNEFGYRALQAGAIVIPERAAVCWHQGEGHEPTPAERESQWLQQPKLSDLIASFAYRRSSPGSSYAVPQTVVVVDASAVHAETAEATVESVLGADYHDLLVCVVLPHDALAAEWLSVRFHSDPRVRLVRDRSDVETISPFSPLTIDLPAGALVHRSSLDEIVGHMWDESIGVLFGTVPGADPAAFHVRAELTRTRNRARLALPDADDLDAAITELFGRRWVSSAALGLGSTGRWGDPVDPQPPGSSGGTSTPVAELEAVVEELRSVRSRRALKLADAFGSLGRSRSITDARFALSALGAAMREGDAADERPDEDAE